MRNKIAIATATDGKGLVIAPEWASKPSKKKTFETFRRHIAPGSKLIHDGDNSRSLLVSELGLGSEAHPTSETRGLPDSENPMDEINAVHSPFYIYILISNYTFIIVIKLFTDKNLLFADTFTKNVLIKYTKSTQKCDFLRKM